MSFPRKKTLVRLKAGEYARTSKKLAAAPRRLTGAISTRYWFTVTKLIPIPAPVMMRPNSTDTKSHAEAIRTTPTVCTSSAMMAAFLHPYCFEIQLHEVQPET